VSEALPCIDAADLFYLPSASTVLECVYRLLGPDEICRGDSDKREIWQGPRVVGFVRVVDRISSGDRSPS
jgi:hypothetical protein